MAHEWKIRNMEEADSAEAVKAAQRHNVTVSVWLGRAIRAYVATERGNGVPAHDIAGPHQTMDQDRLIAMAALELPQWLRRRVHRLLGETLGVAPPSPPKRLPPPPRVLVVGTADERGRVQPTLAENHPSKPPVATISQTTCA